MKQSVPLQDSLFQKNTVRPLADMLRPTNLEQIVGQDHLLNPGQPLRQMVENNRLFSMVLWGPPGCGKTSLAKLIATAVKADFHPLSAIFSGIQDLKSLFEQARRNRQVGRATILFVDEIHRFNRTQQDSFLPVIEDGTVILIGATTENPSFALNPALLSRLEVFVLKRLEDSVLYQMIDRVEIKLGKKLPLNDEAKRSLVSLADGDGRYLLNMIEAISSRYKGQQPLTPQNLSSILSRRAPLYDKAQESHYNLISAFHKSLRGSDVDAALYWMARMLDGGEDPRYIARRLIRFATEDIGLADPQALNQGISCLQAYEKLGSPEGELAIAQATIYMAAAPKSNASYMAFKKAMQLARDYGSLMPPISILNAPTSLMQNLGYGANYQYDHDFPDAFSGQNFRPAGLPDQPIYQPTNFGNEQKIQEKLNWLRQRRQDLNNGTK